MAMEILIAIEKRFGIEVAEEKLLEFRTLRQVMDVVDEYISSA
jgi:acyl carrier protein